MSRGAIGAKLGFKLAVSGNVFIALTTIASSHMAYPHNIPM